MRRLAWAALVLSGCGMRVRHEATVLDQRELLLGERLAAPALWVRSDQDGVLLRVSRDPPCVALAQDELWLSIREVRTARRGPAIAGGVLMGVGALLYAAEFGASEGWADAWGVTLALAGGVSLLAKPQDTEATTTRAVRQPPREVAGDCSALDPEVHAVALLLPDRRLVSAERTATGLWRARLPWHELGTRVPVWVRVDGAYTHLITIGR